MKLLLDVEDPRQTAADLAAAVEATGNGKVSGRLRELLAEIEAYSPKPRIPEPGLWAVVEAGVKQHDVRLKWVRLDGGWQPQDLNEYDRTWDELIDPVLIREGV